MISEALRCDIESFAHELRVSNPMYLKAVEGTLAPEAVGSYLSNIMHLLRHTPPYLARAMERAKAMNGFDLATFFEEKLAEECGHDAWAVDDTRGFAAQLDVQCDSTIMLSMSALLTFLRDTIDEDPTLYLAYILFAEYLTVLQGPEWLALLEERCGISRDLMTSVGNHVELDKQHAEDGLDAIDRLVMDPSYLRPMREVLRRSMGYFDRFMNEVAATPVAPKVRDARDRQIAASLPAW